MSQPDSPNHQYYTANRYLPHFHFIGLSSLTDLVNPLNPTQAYANSNIGKNYTFLLCNGILVFIVKNSGLLGTSHQEINLIKNGESPQKELETVSAEKQEQEIADKCLVMVKGAALITQDVVNEEVNEITMVDEEHEDDEEAQDLVSEEVNEITMVDEEHEDDEEAQDVVSEEVNEIIMVDEEHEDDEEEIGLLNVDELNKKCDDFIRKMKEEIKFEAQQLTLVHH
ncbi:hypothetical protein GH714_022829 [Hevea brasiliensis]|uniref:Uncharacterized protein n=1 Tax=Hevea brasiliensis TaxID=3981 RepID=A0A6A6KWM9_HEVBR|nr:hypothetical protein GH714_022829 [Hevea brasiliensis]